MARSKIHIPEIQSRRQPEPQFQFSTAQTSRDHNHSIRVYSCLGKVVPIDQLKGECDSIWITAASGVAVSMIKEDHADEYEILPTFESKNCVGYTAAAGGRIYEKGKRVPIVKFEAGSTKTMQFKVGKVNKALVSVKEICKAGNGVIFDDDGSYMQNERIGEVVQLYERNNKYVFPIQIVPKSVVTKIGQPASKTSRPSPRPATKL